VPARIDPGWREAWRAAARAPLPERWPDATPGDGAGSQAARLNEQTVARLLQLLAEHHDLR
jgi:hypothetical protein